MSGDYAQQMAKMAVGKILLTLGWHSIQTTPLEVLTEIFTSYITQIGQLTKEYGNQFNCTEPNLDHLGLAYKDFHIDLNDLQDYVKFVNFGEPPDSVPQFPVKKEDHLNFLKPGSREVVTRPVHIHEHLPPMTSTIEPVENGVDTPTRIEEPEECPVEAPAVFKRPADLSPGEPFKRHRFCVEEEGRPTREISSVMMTTSGYLSPAREGKLPESRTPLATIDTPIVANTIPIPEPAKKPTKTTKKLEKNKDKPEGKELFKHALEQKKRKTSNMKESKMKQMKTNNLSLQSNNVLGNNNEIKPINSPSSTKISNAANNKINKTLAAARLKTEKLNTTITPIIPVKQEPPIVPPTQIEPGKLLTEPDKRKIDILKRISNVKNEKIDSKIMKLKDEFKQESRESSPDLIIDESVEVLNKPQNITHDVTIEIIPTPVVKSPEKTEKSYFDDDSPPGTPSTPKTPEMVSQSPPLTKEKRKRKEKSKIKKVIKQSSPNPENMEIDLERPKTPEAHVMLTHSTLPLPFSYFPPFRGPGLIPHPLNNPIFPHLGMPNLRMPTLGSYMPPINRNLMPNPMPRDLTPPTVTEEKSINLVSSSTFVPPDDTIKVEKKTKEHKKEKRDKIKKKNKKDKNKEKSEKRKSREEKKDKEKVKREKKEKKKDKERENEIAVPKLTLKLGTQSPHPEPERKLNIKPIVRKEEEKVPEVKRELSPELAKISPLVTGQPKPKNVPLKEDTVKDETPITLIEPPVRAPGPGRPRIHSIKQKPTTNINKQQALVKDSEGNEVWICPACGRQDDGSPMIGCDDCDAWYHWVCVGIQVPPDDNEDWYCRLCIGKKQELLQTDKKKKRKKRERREH